MIAKILPMTKIIPGQVSRKSHSSTVCNHSPFNQLKPRNIKTVSVDTYIESGDCEKEECMARRELYADIQAKNAAAKRELILLQDRVLQVSHRHHHHINIDGRTQICL